MLLDENRMKDLVIDHKEKQILNEIKWKLKQFYYKEIENMKDIRWNFWLFIFYITIVIDMF